MVEQYFNDKFNKNSKKVNYMQLESWIWGVYAHEFYFLYATVMLKLRIIIS